jgi:hypothetical protein
MARLRARKSANRRSAWWKKMWSSHKTLAQVSTLWLMSKHVGSEIMDQATPVIAFFNTQNGAWPWIFNDKAMGELITAKPLLTTMAFYTSIKSSLPGLTNNTLLNSLYRKVSEMKKQACEGDSRNMFYGCFIFSSMQRESLHPRHHHSNVLLPHC